MNPTHSVTLVVAADRDGIIGRDGDLPWRLPDDLRRFKRLTLGHPILMGRKTHESIGRALPGRKNIVLTRRDDLHFEGCEMATSAEAALALLAPEEELMVIGGAEIYALFLPFAGTIHLTRVDASVGGDVRFPPLDERDWELRETEAHPADEKHAHAFAFQTLVRRS